MTNSWKDCQASTREIKNLTTKCQLCEQWPTPTITNLQFITQLQSYISQEHVCPFKFYDIAKRNAHQFI